MNRVFKIFRMLGELNPLTTLIFALFHGLKIRNTVIFKTRIGNVAIRTCSTDMNVLYGVLFTEYNKLDDLNTCGMHFIDLGAYTGLSTLAARHYLNFSTFTCIEPSTENYSLLTRNLALNGLDTKIAKKAALSSENGKTRISSGGKNQWGFSEFRISEGSKSEECETISLPMLEDVLSREVFLKVDIEGSEVHLLSPINLNIVAKLKYIFIEFHDRITPGVEKEFMKSLELTHKCNKIGNEKYLFQRLAN